MLSRFFLIVTGVLAGLWLRTTNLALDAEWLPWLALLALALAVIAAPRPGGGDTKARMEEAYRQWLDAWQRLHLTSEHERLAAERALSAAGHMVLLTAPDRVVKSMQTATNDHLTAAAVARLVLDMRRSLRRAGVSVRVEDFEALLAQRRHAPAEPRPGMLAPAAAASFLV